MFAMNPPVLPAVRPHLLFISMQVCQSQFLNVLLSDIDPCFALRTLLQAASSEELTVCGRIQVC